MNLAMLSECQLLHLWNGYNNSYPIGWLEGLNEINHVDSSAQGLACVLHKCDCNYFNHYSYPHHYLFDSWNFSLALSYRKHSFFLSKCSLYFSDNFNRWKGGNILSQGPVNIVIRIALLVYFFPIYNCLENCCLFPWITQLCLIMGLNDP